MRTDANAVLYRQTHPYRYTISQPTITLSRFVYPIVHAQFPQLNLQFRCKPVELCLCRIITFSHRLIDEFLVIFCRVGDMIGSIEVKANGDISRLRAELIPSLQLSETYKFLNCFTKYIQLVQ